MKVLPNKTIKDITNMPDNENTPQDVEITFTLRYENVRYPEPTRERVMQDLKRIGDMGDIGYEEIRTNAVNTHELPIQADLFEEINKEPIPSSLETFSDIDNIMEEAHKMIDDIEDAIDTGTRVEYSRENDPFNE